MRAARGQHSDGFTLKSWGMHLASAARVLVFVKQAEEPNMAKALEAAEKPFAPPLRGEVKMRPAGGRKSTLSWGTEFLIKNRAQIPDGRERLSILLTLHEAVSIISASWFQPFLKCQ